MLQVPDTSEMTISNATDSETINRGSKMRIWPSDRQAQLMDTWRRRCISLWNLLLELEVAAYGAKNSRSKIGWRSIWEDVVEKNYAKATLVFSEGKRNKKGELLLNKDGSVKKPAGPQPVLKNGKPVLNDDGTAKMTGEPQPPIAELLAKIRRIQPDGLPVDQAILLDMFGFLRGKLKGLECDHTHKLTVEWLKENGHAAKTDEIVRWLIECGGECDCKVIAELTPHCPAPGLFIWKHELSMIMARLKAVPSTLWVADIPSHAAQRVVADLITALETMLRERKKAKAGAPSRKAGFPRFKKSGAGDGSVYFPNTTLYFDVGMSQVRLPNNCGLMHCEIPRHLKEELLDRKLEPGMLPGTDLGLRGGRIWKQGDRWYLSCQWERPKPDSLPKTGRSAGVKLAAKILLTTFDNRGQTKEYDTPPLDEKLARVHLTAAKQQSRCLEAQKKKKKKKEAWHKQKKAGQARKSNDTAAAAPLKHARLRRSRMFQKTVQRMAACEAIETDRRDGFLHRVTNEVVHAFDVIDLQKMDVTEMMQKERKEKYLARRMRQRIRRQRTEPADKKPSRRSMKSVRKMMRHAAMGRTRLFLEYKFTDLRGPESIRYAEKTEPEVQTCSRCGTRNPQMKDGRRLLRCIGNMPDGTPCKTILPRNRNAARNAQARLKKHLEKKRESGNATGTTRS